MPDPSQQTTVFPAHIFYVWAHDAIETMRRAGMNETIIACVVTEIRSAALHEERHRMALVLDANPPQHISGPDMQKALTHER